MSAHLRTAIAYAILLVAFIVIGFGPLTIWQQAVSNGAICVATLVIILGPMKKETS